MKSHFPNTYCSLLHAVWPLVCTVINSPCPQYVPEQLAKANGHGMDQHYQQIATHFQSLHSLLSSRFLKWPSWRCSTSVWPLCLLCNTWRWTSRVWRNGVSCIKGCLCQRSQLMHDFDMTQLWNFTNLQKQLTDIELVIQDDIWNAGVKNLWTQQWGLILTTLWLVVLFSLSKQPFNITIWQKIKKTGKKNFWGKKNHHCAVDCMSTQDASEC